MMFEVIDIDGFGRIGKLNINNKEILTPTILPVIHPYNNEMSIGLIQKLGAEIIFTNSYILYQNKTKREEALSKGLHNFLGFNGIIATDSGAFQQYMYNKEHLEIQPEIIERFQEEIGSDLPVILDVPVQLDDNFSAARNKVSKTILRAKDNIRRRKSEKCNWIGPIHGGSYHSLLKKSAIELSKLDFPILAIGGLVKAYMNYQFDLAIDILLTVKKYVDQAKPIHMFGLGLPQFFSLAVACGCDLMDSAAYYLYAKENRYFSLSTGTKRLEELQEFPCNCPICSSFTPKEVLNEKERSRVSLIAQHNLHITFSELKTIRQAMYEGNLWELVETRIRNHPSLLKAYNVIKQHRKDIEINEKVYKEHGRLFASYDSFNRPLFYRHQQKLNNNYRTPKNTTSLLIIPELDVSADNSPTINEWINTIRNNGIICLESINILLASNYFGFIPYELINTYPYGQYEALKPNFENVTPLEILLLVKRFIKKFATQYKKIAILIPNFYINESLKKIKFPDSHILQYLSKILKKIYKDNFGVFDNPLNVIEFFKG